LKRRGSRSRSPGQSCQNMSKRPFCQHSGFRGSWTCGLLEGFLISWLDGIDRHLNMLAWKVGTSFQIFNPYMLAASKQMSCLRNYYSFPCSTGVLQNLTKFIILLYTCNIRKTILSNNTIKFHGSACIDIGFNFRALNRHAPKEEDRTNLIKYRVKYFFFFFNRW
jgi:hypothetical protein